MVARCSFSKFWIVKSWVSDKCRLFLGMIFDGESNGQLYFLRCLWFRLGGRGYFAKCLVVHVRMLWYERYIGFAGVSRWQIWIQGIEIMPFDGRKLDFHEISKFQDFLQMWPLLAAHVLKHGRGSSLARISMLCGIVVLCFFISFYSLICMMWSTLLRGG